jgi:hypothetical protein
VVPLQLILAALVGWLERGQHDVIEYLREENRVLKAQLHGRRLRLTDDERRRLAVLGTQLRRRLLMQMATIVTPDTILRWHRQLIRCLTVSRKPADARGGDSVQRRAGHHFSADRCRDLLPAQTHALAG